MRTVTLRQKDCEVGYKRPPKHTQWKKGQCGNPKRQYRCAPKGTVALIDELLEEQIIIVEAGVSRRISVFEAILLQLWSKEMAGDKRAIAVRLKYQEFVSQPRDRPEIIVEGGLREQARAFRTEYAWDERL
jgi:Family of unknown function (DUF5681)